MSVYIRNSERKYSKDTMKSILLLVGFVFMIAVISAMEGPPAEVTVVQSTDQHLMKLLDDVDSGDSHSNEAGRNARKAYGGGWGHGGWRRGSWGGGGWGGHRWGGHGWSGHGWSNHGHHGHWHGPGWGHHW